MTEPRPDPDVLLRRLFDEKHQEGRLRIFLGASPGVGKTYAMLRAAGIRQAQGKPVLVGYVETHGRAETEALLAGLEILPVVESEYRGIRLREFDLDAALARQPETILVDELAHTNAPGSRHAKRWQDVLELLANGIHVWTTVNIQHLESLNDAVERVTGVRVREIVPNHVWERADAVELIDLPPEELLDRLKAGKVYVPGTVEQALTGFFRPEKLTALRELSLRQTAQRVDDQIADDARRGRAAPAPSAGERILVSVGPGPFSARLVRATKIMADELHARWYAVTIETPEHSSLPEADKERIRENMHLAATLGAETWTLTGERIGAGLLEFAREHRVNRILIGKPLHSRWKDLLKGSLLDEVIRGSGDIDVHVITGVKPDPAAAAAPRPRRWPSPAPYLWALLIVALVTGANYLLRSRVELQDIVLLYLLGVVWIAFRFAFGPAALASLLSVAAFDYFFVPPVRTFSVSNPMHLLTFAVMLVVSFVIADLAWRSRARAEAARRRDRESRLLFNFTDRLAGAATLDALLRAAVESIQEDFPCRGTVFFDGPDGFAPGLPADNPVFGEESATARWVLENSRPAGNGTQTLAGARALYLPVAAAGKTLAVLALLFEKASPYRDPEQRRLLETLTRQFGLFLERMLLEREARASRLRADEEQLRNALLSSLSHDLRTPLAAIIGSATTQLAVGPELAAESRQELNQAILEEAERMNRLVGNLLDMTKLVSGSLTPKREWQPLEEIVGSALRRLQKQLAGHDVRVRLDDPPPLIWADSLLLEQVLVNLLDNAAKYTPPGTWIEIRAENEPDLARLVVEDAGPGFPAAEAERLFERFFRGAASKGHGGSGLGLSICRGIVEIHGGRVWAEARPGGGARFVVELPTGGTPAPAEPPADEEPPAGER
ncbi:MAG: sensor histidine kinase KdpD [Myxococcales bacterium]|nr:sensor histidine kinase KdpD [Myxococcales bacterium]